MAMEIDQHEMDRRFSYHPPTDGVQAAKYAQIRQKAREFAELVLELTPPSREQSVALTEIETAVFWANAGIARQGKPST